MMILQRYHSPLPPSIVSSSSAGVSSGPVIWGRRTNRLIRTSEIATQSPPHLLILKRNGLRRDYRVFARRTRQQPQGYVMQGPVQSSINPKSESVSSAAEWALWVSDLLKQGARAGVPPPPSQSSPTVQLVHPKSSRGRKIVLNIVIASAIYIGFNLEKAPYTGRIRLLAIPVSMELLLAKNFLTEKFPDSMVLHGDASIATDNLVRILVETAEREFLGNIRPANATTTFPWNITVIDNPMVNAFCAPGGSVVVFSGLLDFCVEAERQEKVENAASAVCGVIAHEISHGVLRHGMETLSWLPLLMIIMLFAQAFFVSLGFGPDEVKLLNTVFQEVVQFFLRLPHSRKVESEADLLGSELLMKAGLPVDDYPRVLSLLQSGNAEWFSTHPAPERRSLAIYKHLQDTVEEEEMESDIPSKVRGRNDETVEDAHVRYWRFFNRPNKSSNMQVNKIMSWLPTIAD